MTTHYDNCDRAAEQIIKQVGKKIVIGIPLGLGKPIGFINALYRLAESDKSINLTIITGLTLSRPRLHNELEKCFIDPILNRILKDYEDPLYEKARELQTLPENIKVIEFFLTTAKYLHNSDVQQNYISSAYTNVIRDCRYYSLNVIAQQVAISIRHPDQYSLSCNSDLFEGVVQDLNQSKRKGNQIAIVAEVNQNLPFMYGDSAVIKSSKFTDIIDTKRYHALFALPRDEITPQDQLIGIYTSCLIKDDSSLQVGIGKLGNSLASALILRHQHNDIYCELLDKLSINDKFGGTINAIGSSSTFKAGIYAPTEMLSDEYMQLYQADILKKRVYDHVGLQRLINVNKITDEITPQTLDVLLENGVIQSKLTASNFKFLKKFGIIKSNIQYDDGYIILPLDEKIPANLSQADSKKKIISHCLGDKLLGGKIAHAGFFLGSTHFYNQLNNLTHDEMKLIEMTTINRTNSFQWSYRLAQLQHQYARFVNSSMMVTLGGVIISDGLTNLQEVSGVGGQFDFVYMSQRIRNARSIINCPSTRRTKNGIASNIVWEYPNYTIPRFLRDIVVTEYGIADCRSKTDSEIIKSILNVTDSRFQEKLLIKAKKSGKLPPNYEIPSLFKHNFPKNYEKTIREFQSKGYCKPFPFGSDLTEEEQVISHALLFLKYTSKKDLIILILQSIFFFENAAQLNPYLHRLGLEHPKNMKEWIYKKLIKYILCKKIAKW